MKQLILTWKKNLALPEIVLLIANMGAVTDDEVIRKRLLIDGDGAGDDRRINLLLKSFTKWCNSPGTPEEGFTQYQRMLGTLAQCEFSMGKTLMVYDMNLREMENYEKIYSNIEQNITSAHEKIAECKKDIQRAKRIRKNRQEYDALAKVIQQHPDRHETLKQLEALDKELQQLSHIKENVDAKVNPNRIYAASVYFAGDFIYFKVVVFFYQIYCSTIVGVEEEAVPCSSYHHSGATTDT
uniref:THO complex 7 n=1 Tax=Oryzias latipes TaxID=8090 RepID=A0A3P9KJZ6_ORYLA